MNLQKRVVEHFERSIQCKRDSIASLSAIIVESAQHIFHQLQLGKKILSCGNGGSAADAQHFSAELINRYYRERKAIAAIALTTDSSTLTSIANDYHFDSVFSRQIEGIGLSGDLLLAISTSGNSPNILHAIDAAHALDMTVIALTGRDGGKIAPRLKPSDFELRIPNSVTAHIQETHLLVIHCLCDLIDEQLGTLA